MHSSTATLAAFLVIAPLLANAAVTYTFEAAPNGGEIANAYASVGLRLRSSVQPES